MSGYPTAVGDREWFQAEIRRLEGKIDEAWRRGVRAGTQRASNYGIGNLNRIINPDFRVNQGYVSAASLPPQSYGPDGWGASGLINHFLNPQAVGAGNIEANSGVTVAAISTDTFTGWTSGRSFKITTTTTSSANARQVIAQGPVAHPDEPWNVSAKFYNAAAGTRNFAISLRFLDAANASLQTDSGAVAIAAGGTATITATGVAPLNTVRAIVLFQRTSGSGALSGDIYYADEVMIYRGAPGAAFFDGSTGMWSGAADASTSYNITSVGSITMPTDPQGGLATLSSGMRIFQGIERANIQAGVWLFNQSGTAKGRVYNAATSVDSRPTFTAFPITFVADGLDDVIVEAYAEGGTATFGQAQLIPGTVTQPYVSRLLAHERRLCEYFYRRLVLEGISTSMPFGTGVMTSTTNLTVNIPGVRMRALPTVAGTAAASLQVRTAGSLTVSAYVMSPGSSPDAIVLDVTTSAGTAGQAGLFRGTALGHYLELNAYLRVYAA